jgi:ssDNA-binding Zn-finger/Zn-ribbon topoisomerase 1
MKTLEDHNNEAYERYKAFANYELKAGVACPKCKTEMQLAGEPGMTLACWPPKKAVKCPECGHLDYKVS